MLKDVLFFNNVIVNYGVIRRLDRDLALLDRLGSIYEHMLLSFYQYLYKYNTRMVNII